MHFAFCVAPAVWPLRWRGGGCMGFDGDGALAVNFYLYSIALAYAIWHLRWRRRLEAAHAVEAANVFLFPRTLVTFSELVAASFAMRALWFFLSAGGWLGDDCPGRFCAFVVGKAITRCSEFLFFTAFILIGERANWWWWWCGGGGGGGGGGCGGGGVVVVVVVVLVRVGVGMGPPLVIGWHRTFMRARA